MRRYFRRYDECSAFILVATAPDDAGCGFGNLGEEISEEDLPKDIDDWRFYTSYSQGLMLVEIWTPFGSGIGKSSITYREFNAREANV